MNHHQEQSNQIFQECFKKTNEIVEVYGTTMKEIEPYQKDIFSNLKDFIKLIIGLSAGIIGFAVPIFGQTNIINYIGLFKVSLGGFLLAMILGIIYLYKLIIDDRKYLQKVTKTLSDAFANEIKYTQQNNQEIGPEQITIDNFGLIQRLTQDMVKDLPTLKAWNYLRHITCGIFVISLILLFISII